MNYAHGILIILWIAYCFIHSFFADTNVKKNIEKAMGKSYKYYRPLYAFFAMVTLGWILWFQFTIQGTLLFKTSLIFYVPGILIALTGLCIMLVCINKYFFELSGLQAIRQSNVKNTLQQSGLHQYVRHPLYLGTLLFIGGLFLLFPLISNGIAVIIITAYVWIGITLEEKKLLLEYGNCYKEYSKKVPKIIPRFKVIKKGSV